MTIDVVETVPKDLFKVSKGAKNLGIYTEENPIVPEKWRKIIYGYVENTFRSYGYFNIVDLKNREKLIKELILIQKGLGDSTKNLGEQLTAQLILFIELPRSPGFECVLKEKMIPQNYCVEWTKKGMCRREATRYIKQYSKILYTTVPITARLSNVSSFESLEYTTAETTEISNPGESCPSEQLGFEKAVQYSSDQIAINLSPKVRPFRTKLFEDTIGVRDDLEKKVKSHLLRGNAWMNSNFPNYENAKKEWEKALIISENTSAIAYWNLALYFWHFGDSSKASEYFQKAIEIAGPEWLNSSRDSFISFLSFVNSRRDVYDKFIKEKERLELERN